MRDDVGLTDNDEELLAEFKQMPPLDPPDDLLGRFADRLAAQRAVVRLRFGIPLAIAALLALILGSGWLLEWRRRETQVSELRTQLAHALTDLSAAKRMEAIAQTDGLARHDDAVVATLTTVLLSDSSIHVRVAAAEALGRIASPVALANAVGRAVAVDQSPFVQSALLAVIDHLDDRARAKIVRALLARPDLDPFVRAAAESRVAS